MSHDIVAIYSNPMGQLKSAVITIMTKIVLF